MNQPNPIKLTESQLESLYKSGMSKKRVNLRTTKNPIVMNVGTEDEEIIFMPLH